MRRTLVRNGYEYHLNEIFATVQNEYSDWMASTEEDVRPRRLLSLAADAITDRLYLAPAIEAAEWCEASGFPLYFYVFGGRDGTGGEESDDAVERDDSVRERESNC